MPGQAQHYDSINHVAPLSFYNLSGVLPHLKTVTLCVSDLKTWEAADCSLILSLLLFPMDRRESYWLIVYS